MKIFKVLTVFALALSFTSQGLSAEVERVHFQSYSPYGFADIVDGLDNDPKVEIFGDLKIPEGTQGKRPAFLVVHGSGGWSPRHEKWIDLFQSMGIATFRIDSFTPRGVSKTTGNQTNVTGEMMVADAFMALKMLSEHPRIDPNRIGIIGGSKGGGTSLYTSWEPLRKAALKNDMKFAFHIPLYPPCLISQKVIDVTEAPVDIHIGALDNWTPAAHCTDYVSRLKGENININLSVYDGAYHGFDAIYPPKEVPKGLNLTNCKLVVDEDGTTNDPKTGLTFSTPENKRKIFGACISRGTTIGANADAMEKTKEAVRMRVQEIFGL